MKVNKQNESIVEIRNLSLTRGSQQIFNQINLTIERGKVTAIMGPSGCGKTTLLNVIGGQLPAQQGQVMVNGDNILALNSQQLYRVRRSMGMLFQSGALFSDMNVFDNVAFPIREHTNLCPLMVKDVVLMKLQAVGLRGARELMPHELSGGMRRRAALARTIALDPSLIMYDEPFAGQDPISMGALVKLIRLLNDTLDLTSVIVSHDVPETVSIADYIYLIAQGQVIGAGTPEALMNHSSSWVRQFMHGLPDGPVPFHYPAQNYANDLLGE